MLHARELLKVKDLRRNKTRQKEENNSRWAVPTDTSSI
jgi:hypothetical protein